MYLICSSRSGILYYFPELAEVILIDLEKVYDFRKAYTEILNSQTTQFEVFYSLGQLSDLHPYFMSMIVYDTDIDSVVHKLPQKSHLVPTSFVAHCMSE